MRRLLLILSIPALAAGTVLAAVQDITLTVQVDRPGAKINPAMWGIFFEDINFGADGGLYAELVKNRSFEFPESFMGWTARGETNAGNAIEIRTEDPFNPSNPNYVRLTVGQAGDGFGIVNEGFRGMGIRDRESYNLSLQARAITGKPTLKVELIAADGRPLGAANVGSLSPRWKKHTARLRASATEPKAHLRITVVGTGTVDLDMVSLFPQRTWKNRPNGLRADLVQMLADLKPGFMRFPGGCIVEGRVLTNRYQWKDTIGDVAERQLIMNRWNVEFARRGLGAPDYYQSFGLGFFEYFQLCEDLGAEPMPILNCGMACQFNSGELAPLDQLDPYIQDALDLIEFANGPANSPWGSRRAAMGQPRPFRLKMIGIGNEQWGPEYIERYARFAEVLKEKHPEIQLISAVGPDPSGPRFDFLWSQLRELNADIIDEHFYRPPDWFFNNINRYDEYDRNGPRILAGEYAAHVGSRANNLESAIAEAAVMTGFERNADIVRMTSYAPLFAHVDAWQWRPDLIWFDNLTVFGTPNYYVQKLFSVNRGDHVLPVRTSSGSTNVLSRVVASATRDEKSGDVILKVVNATPAPVNGDVRISGVRSLASGTRTVLTSASLNDENSIGEPRKIHPVVSRFDPGATAFQQIFPPNSVSVYRMSARPK